MKDMSAFLYCDKCKKPFGDTCYCKILERQRNKIKKDFMKWFNKETEPIEDFIERYFK